MLSLFSKSRIFLFNVHLDQTTSGIVAELEECECEELHLRRGSPLACWVMCFVSSRSLMSHIVCVELCILGCIFNLSLINTFDILIAIVLVNENQLEGFVLVEKLHDTKRIIYLLVITIIICILQVSTFIICILQVSTIIDTIRTQVFIQV